MKVVKFGGSSMADAGQYRKVRDILMADPDRRVVIVSAAGKRFSKDHKLTDLLYQTDDGKMLSGQGNAVRQPRRVDALHVRRVEPIAIPEQQGRDDGRSAVPHP